MDFEEWVASQFTLTKLENGRILFRTPCINYTFTKEELEFFRRLFNEFSC